MRKNAFTLAEVLITLGIIGVVAAMTLPALITRNQNKALEAGLKKNYSVILQAFEMYQAETGERLLPEATRDGEVENKKIKKQIMPYFKIIKDCGYTDTACIRFGTRYEHNSKNYKTYSKKDLTQLNLFDDGQFILTDGSLILLNDSCDTKKYISVDVNGYIKNPNRWGQDLFTFQLMKDGRILPMGAEGTTYTDKSKYCSPTSTDPYNGIGCTYYALNDKDYFNNLPR